METTNKLMAMFDIEKCKRMIKDCPTDEIVILCPHWSINKPDYSNEEESNEDWDLDELSDELGEFLMVNDYDDLIADPRGLMSE
jgi:hypothetical protein